MKTFPYFITLLFTILHFSCEQSNEQPYDSIDYSIFFGENKAGFQSSSKTEEGFQYVFEFNDRGRGPHFEETIRINENGVPSYFSVSGVNYYKDSISENFWIENGKAIWKSNTEVGEKDFDGNSAYYNINGSFGMSEHLVRKLLESENGTIDLIPSGQIRLSSAEQHTFRDSIDLTHVELTGAGFTPNYYWIDENKRFFAYTTSWFACIRDGYDSLRDELMEIQQNKEDAYLENVAKKISEVPEKGILIRNVRTYDVVSGEVKDGQSILVEGNQIKSISNNLSETDGYRIVNGNGMFAMPGLFDMHTHVGKSDGILHIAAGVTSIRDLANSMDLLKTEEAFNNNTLIGPRLVTKAGFIDQSGPYAGPGLNVGSLEEGLESIQMYKDAGYNHIKLYSSIDPAWVKPMADKAHQLGMRVSGHIPAYMLAEEAIEAGFDEIQHVNMVALNFLPDTIDTRTPLRFSMIGQHTGNLDLEGSEFTDFVELLRSKNIVVDPTVSIFQAMLATKAGEPDPSFEMILDRLPINVARGFYSGGLSIPEDQVQTYKDSFQKLIEIVGRLHASGVTIVPGTDDMAGFGLHRELENYVKAGISTTDVLKVATITSAQVAGVSETLGSLEVGKLADIILIEGDPTSNISDIRKVALTIKDGIIYDTKTLYQSIGVKHYK